MSNGMCSRRQKGLLQTGFCVLVVLCFGFGLYTYTQLKENVRSTEMLAQKYKQQQESVSAQLQVVYEHRSRLERSLQKERNEHKKTKEDFLVYKLEAQESLNKEKQDAMNRYSALSSQHKILKNQHDEVRKQLAELQVQHNGLQLEHRKAVEAHSQQFLKFRQQKELEISSLQENILKLRQESRQLRKAHQEMHDQLAKAQSQVEEFRQLKQALNGMPSFKNPGLKQEQNQAGHRQPWGPASSQLKFTEQKGARTLVNGQIRTLGGATEQDRQPERDVVAPQQEHLMSNKLQLEGRPVNRQWPPKRWVEIINDVNRDIDFEPDSQPEQRPAPPLENRQEPQATPAKSTSSQWGAGHGNADWNVDRARDGKGEPEEERETMNNRLKEVDKMDAGKLFAHVMSSRRQLIPQEPLIPDIDQDPAQDPNNQGEDEFEEAELERPGYAAKAPGLSALKDQLLLKAGAKNVDAASREGDNVDEYQEDQETENEDNGGEMDDEDPDAARKDDIQEDTRIQDEEANKEEEY
ncbi:Golgi integral membrane protein 4-like isoform X2 [Hypanus sabinus]|uniref:Golgi integral membrane protein 4-like isoform X2 n=1 Tax=Hypanus sabinus TaxID=79690 RepID=UPI0028C3CD94|nr:Golgi integral membrane protein 4-like isoform X2 [Hypanus sabinus]